MNPTIKNCLDTEQPKINTLTDKEKKIYKTGLTVLGLIVCDDFFDLPRLSKDKYSTDGLFYEIPYYDSKQLWESNNQRFLLVVYKIEKTKTGMSSWCPMRIDFKIIDEKNYSILVYDQSGEELLKEN